MNRGAAQSLLDLPPPVVPDEPAVELPPPDEAEVPPEPDAPEPLLRPRPLWLPLSDAFWPLRERLLRQLLNSSENFWKRSVRQLR